MTMSDYTLDYTAKEINEKLAQVGTNKEEIGKLSQEKADKSYVVSVFEQLKQLIQNGDIESAVAVLDEAILDLSTLS